MRELSEIKRKYTTFGNSDRPSDEEMTQYGISDDDLREWMTEKALDNKKSMERDISSFSHYIFDELIEKKDKIIHMNSIMIGFLLASSDRIFTHSYYYEILDNYKMMYENDMFDFLTYREYGYGNEYHTRIMFANQEKIELDPQHVTYSGQKYSGLIPPLYYSNHQEVFEEVLLYFANKIFIKYGLYLQDAMKVLIKFCKEYDLPYVSILEESITKAKACYKNVRYKYQLIESKKCEWWI